MTTTLARARADLDALPGLYEQLGRTLTEKPASSGGPAGKPGSKPPLRLDVLALADERHKPDWDGSDPRLAPLSAPSVPVWTDGAGRTVVEPRSLRYGILPALESWTRSVAEDRRACDLWEPPLADVPTMETECHWLVTVWDYISAQDYADEIATDITKIASLMRSALGYRRPYLPHCRYCHHRVIPVGPDDQQTGRWEDAGYGLCAGCGETYPIGPALSALFSVQETTLRDAAMIVNRPIRTLQDWAKTGVIQPVRRDGFGRRLYDLDAIRKACEIVKPGPKARTA